MSFVFMGPEPGKSWYSVGFFKPDGTFYEALWAQDLDGAVRAVSMLNGGNTSMKIDWQDAKTVVPGGRR